MNQQEQFTRLLNELVEKLQDRSQISISEIKQHFKEINLTEEQFEPVFAYLTSKKITIQNYIKNSSDFMSNNHELKMDENDDSEEKSLKFYLEEVKDIEEFDKKKNEFWVTKLIEGNNEAKEAIVRGNLKLVIRIAEKYLGHGVSVSDLIQEGNIGLLDAVDEILDKADNIKIEEYMEQKIHAAMKQIIEEQSSTLLEEQEMVWKVKKVSDAAKKIKEETGRTADIQEVAEYLNVTVDEMKNWIHLSKDLKE